MSAPNTTTNTPKPSTAARLHLRLTACGVGIRVEPAFWLIAAALGLGLPYLEWLVWVMVALTVVLVHESAHVLAFRAAGIRSRVVVSIFGGRTIPFGEDPDSDTGSARGLSMAGKLGVALSGPLASFLLAGSCYFLLPLMVSTSAGPGGAVYYHLVRASVAWGAVNLMPIAVFDGGYVLRTLMEAFTGSDAAAWSSVISIATTVAMVVATWQFGAPIASAFFAYCALTEWQRTLA